MNRQDRAELEVKLDDTVQTITQNAMKAITQAEIVIKRGEENKVEIANFVKKSLDELKREQLVFHKIQMEAIRRGTIIGIIRGWLKI